MTNKTLMLNFNRGTISLDDVVKGKEIIKQISKKINRVETISVISKNKGYIVTTEKFDEDLELIRYYYLQNKGVKMISQRFEENMKYHN